jgi:hypothetical protein
MLSILPKLFEDLVPQVLLRTAKPAWISVSALNAASNLTNNGDINDVSDVE